MEPGNFNNTFHNKSQTPPSIPQWKKKQLEIELRRLESEKKNTDKKIHSLAKGLDFAKTRELALNDFYYFCHKIMGFKDLYEPLHGYLCERISDFNNKRKLILIPRGHFKTTIISICLPAWLLCRDQSERIILISANASKAEENLEEIVQRIISPTFQHYFGDLIPPIDRWIRKRQDQIRIPRKGSVAGPSIMCLGVDSAEVGRHGSVMLIDDMVGKEQVNTPMSRQKVWGWFTRQLSVLDPNCPLIVLGTRWHEDDPYAKLQNMPEWEVIKMKVKEPWPDGPYIFPTRFNDKVVNELKEIQDDYTFSCFYLNEPVGEGINPFNVDKLKWVDYPLVENPYNVKRRKERTKEDEEELSAWTYIIIDPATTVEDYSCPTGFLIVDALSNKLTVVRRAILHKYHPDELVSKLFDLVGEYNPHKVIIETEAQQHAYAYWIRKEMIARKKFFRIVPVKNPRRTRKTARLLELQPFLHNHDIVFYKNMPGKEDIIRELATYPKGKDDDLIICLSFIPEAVKFPPRFVKPQMRKKAPVKSRKLEEMIQQNYRPKRFGRMPRIGMGRRI